MKLYLSLNGESSKILHPDLIRANVARGAAAAGLDFEDLTLEIDGIRDWKRLKTLLSRPGVYVLNDSVGLHLGATNPYIQISRDLPWVTSTLDPNCIGLFTQAMLETGQGVVDLTSSLTKQAPIAQKAPETFHMVNEYVSGDSETIARHGLAAASWGRVCHAGDIHYQFHFFDSQSLPHVWNIMEQLDQMAPAGALCIFTNRDICLVPEGPAIIKAFMANRGIDFAHAHRIDIHEFRLFDFRDLNGPESAGKDLFCWIKGYLPPANSLHKNLMLGREGWDAEFGLLFGGTRTKIPYPVCYHLAHTSEWNTGGDNSHNQIILSLLNTPITAQGAYQPSDY